VTPHAALCSKAPAVAGRNAAASPPEGMRRHALYAWPEIARVLRPAAMRCLFLDFDGTLAPIRRRPEKVRCAPRLRKLLARLAARPDFWIGIVSGRRTKTLERVIAVPGLHYRGVYGAESEESPLRLSARARQALARSRRALAQRLKGLRGVWLEDKGMSFAVHYRGASERAVAGALAVLGAALAPAARFLRVISGRKTWEVVPRQIPGKGAAVSAVMQSLPRHTVAAYIGDDAADEDAFEALPDGITIRVGPLGNSRARYFLRSPAEVYQWLLRVEEAVK